MCTLVHKDILWEAPAVCSAPLLPGRVCSPLSAQLCKDSRASAGLRECWGASQELLLLKCACDRGLVTKWSPYSWGTKGFLQMIFLRPWENVMIFEQKFESGIFHKITDFPFKNNFKSFTGRWIPNSTYLKCVKSLEMPLRRRRQSREGRQWLRGRPRCLLRRAAGAWGVRALHRHLPLQQPCSKDEGCVEIHHTAFTLHNAWPGQPPRGRAGAQETTGMGVLVSLEVEINFSLLETD